VCNIAYGLPVVCLKSSNKYKNHHIFKENLPNKENQMFKLIQNGKTIFQSAKKIDAIFEHQNYKRSDRVRLVG
jgi:hypothetical protein|tara:strand:+ start:688 stop:906 length:219 start_codon:yes stop_codon:yes gene_type:complete